MLAAEFFPSTHEKLEGNNPEDLRVGHGVLYTLPIARLYARLEREGADEADILLGALIAHRGDGTEALKAFIISATDEASTRTWGKRAREGTVWYDESTGFFRFEQARIFYGSQGTGLDIRLVDFRLASPNQGQGSELGQAPLPQISYAGDLAMRSVGEIVYPGPWGDVTPRIGEHELALLTREC